jgi:CubicO group peptidase (beta-lactamase class C family)
MPLAATFAQLAAAAGYGREDPLVIAATLPGGRRAHLVRGCVPVSPPPAPPAAAPPPALLMTRLGEKADADASPRDFPMSRPDERPEACGPESRRLTTRTQVYVASLAKQVTAACAALLARDRALDIEAPLAAYVGDLPSWSRTVRLRHLVHHTSGLPQEVTSLDGLAAGPGTRYAYSNAGYVLLAAAVAAAAGEPLPGLARRRIFEPLGMADTLFWPGPAPAPPGAAPLDPVHPAPLSLGDGGLWSTAEDLLRWSAGLDDDRLGITARLQAPGRLDDGTELDYAWGMGVRRSRGQVVYRHGGSYADVRTMLVRVPERGFDLVILSLADRSTRWTALTDALLA